MAGYPVSLPNMTPGGPLNMAERIPAPITAEASMGKTETLTSGGSGSVIMLLLLVFFHRSSNILVGTDIVHTVILPGVTGLGQLSLRTVNFSLVGWFSMGSVPGGLLGSRLTGVVPTFWLRRSLPLLLVGVGSHLLYQSGGVLAFD